MKARFCLFSSICLLAGCLVLAPAGAHAQATKIFVASTGNDANDGSRGLPKRNFQAAHDAVAAGGEVVALDTAGYGALTITKSVGITAPAGITGFITTSGSATGVTVNSGASDTVSLRGLTINAVNKTGSPLGILLTTAASLSVSDCTISGYTRGIGCAPTVAATVTLSNSTLRGNSSAAFVLASNLANSVRITIDDCALVSNGTDGLIIGGSSVSGVAHRAEVHNTSLANNAANGVFTPEANAFTILRGCTVFGNNVGINVQSGAAAKVDGCAIRGNNTGISVSGAGSSLLSRLNNTLEDNGSDGTFSGTYAAK